MIAATVAAAWTVLVGVFLYVGFRADDPGLPLLLLLVVLVVAVIGLIVLVLRTLLRQATTLRADLDGVIRWPSSCASMSNWRNAR